MVYELVIISSVKVWTWANDGLRPCTSPLSLFGIKLAAWIMWRSWLFKICLRLLSWGMSTQIRVPISPTVELIARTQASLSIGGPGFWAHTQAKKEFQRNFLCTPIPLLWDRNKSVLHVVGVEAQVTLSMPHNYLPIKQLTFGVFQCASGFLSLVEEDLICYFFICWRNQPKDRKMFHIFCAAVLNYQSPGYFGAQILASSGVDLSPHRPARTRWISPGLEGRGATNGVNYPMASSGQGKL